MSLNIICEYNISIKYILELSTCFHIFLSIFSFQGFSKFPKEGFFSLSPENQCFRVAKQFFAFFPPFAMKGLTV